jgi:hypothetical protein
MNLKNRENIKLIIALAAGFLIGLGSIMIQYWDRGSSTEDMVNAYDNGYNEALKTNPPSDRLEIVCAALWFRGEVEKEKK